MPDYIRRRNRAEERDLAEYVSAIETLAINNEARARMGQDEPLGWNRLDEDFPCQPTKTKLTIRLDTDMVEWYRALGNGYQTRINAVLRAYMKGVRSRWIQQRGDVDVKGDPI